MSTTNFFPSAAAGWDRLHAGPLADHVDDFADWLADQGYARRTGRRKLRLAGQFSRWLGDQGLDLPALDELQLERFRSFRSRLGKYTANIMSDGRELLTWLREAERLAPIGPEPSYGDPVGGTVDRYERFLFGGRGSPRHVQPPIRAGCPLRILLHEPSVPMLPRVGPRCPLPFGRWPPYVLRTVPSPLRRVVLARVAGCHRPQCRGPREDTSERDQRPIRGDSGRAVAARRNVARLQRRSHGSKA